MPSSIDQSYLDYWGFDRAPFALTPDPDMLYLSKQHRECMLRLQYAIAGNKGGALLVSENPGDGKTSVLKRLEKDLLSTEGDKYRIVFIDHPTLTSNQMLWEIMRQLGIGEAKGEKIQHLLQLRGALVEMYEKGERCIFILDEGQLLADRPELLQEFRVLLNYTVGETFLLTFIFSGQAELEGTMKGLPEFYQRLPVRYFLHSMDLADTGRMLEHRIKIAGYRGPELFSEEAVKEIYRYSKGIPRVTCSVADLTLVVGHSRSIRKIHEREVFMAIRDLDRSTQDGYHYYHFLRSAGSASPEEQEEIAQAEAALDKREAEAALERLEAAERGGAGEETVTRLAAEIEAWQPEEGEEPPDAEAAEPAMLFDEEEPGEEREEIGEAEEWSEVEEEEPEEGEEETSEDEEWVSEEEEEEEEVVVEEESEEWLPDSEIGEWQAPQPVEREELVHCPSCGIRQRADRSTCIQCGGPLHWICPSCEHQNSAHRGRCDRCGQSLSGAIAEAEQLLRETISSSVEGPEWGIVSAPDYSLKLSEGERILAVVRNKPLFARGISVRSRTLAWGAREYKVDLVVTNHRLHAVTRELQSRIPYHEIQGVRSSKGKAHLFFSEGGLRMTYPASETAVHSLMRSIIEYLEFQAGLFRV